MATYPSEKHIPSDDPVPDSPISAANSRRGSIETLEPSAAIPPLSPPAYEQTTDTTRPTVASPFNFPTTSPPSYSQSTKKLTDPIAIPQLRPSSTSPLAPAYPPVLLSLGIPRESWLSFLDTLSAFLTATISKKALTHAADIASNVASIPTQLGKDLRDNAVSISKQIGYDARRGNVPAVVHGAIGLTLGSVGQVVGSVFSLPARTAGAVLRKPKTPQERAQAYVVAANRDWFHRRGLHAQMMGSGELARLLDVADGELLGAVKEGGGQVAEGLKGLSKFVGELEVEVESRKGDGKVGDLSVDRSTLWLVVVAQEKSMFY